MGSEPCDWNVHEICSEPSVWLSAHLHAHVRHTCHCTLHVIDKCAVIRLSDVFVNWAVRPMTDVCMKVCSRPIVLLSAHLYAHVSHSGPCTFSCTWCVLVNVQWTDCLMCSCYWAVGTMTNVCMKMCSEPNFWLSCTRQTHESLHVYMHVNVQWFDCLMCSIIGQWAEWPMCAWKCAVSQLSYSLHIYMHMSDTRVTARLRVHANVHWSDCPMCSCKWGVSRVTEMCMSEPSVWLTAHLLAHVRYSGHCMFTCTWYVHVNVQWSDCVMCSIIGQWAQWLMCAWKCAVSRLSYSLHISMHTSITRVTARLHGPDVCW